ncbi:hypothetical protein [Knoellia flava]|uniref:Uncharacterized protein n=2 Tax=Knoellia flava TaxID=913969 RepID=A0A8H9FUM6_9MICO|nr:hypothetical protein [Knoellia flava]GGB75504.1 hypothetical protein GCM10011314_13810 [Knoellia flava]
MDMQNHSVRGHLWMLTLIGDSLSLVRLTPSRLGQRAAGGWTQRVMPVSNVRAVKLTPPRLLRRGRLTLHLEGPSQGGVEVETIHFERSQHRAMTSLAGALREAVDGSGAGVVPASTGSARAGRPPVPR